MSVKTRSARVLLDRLAQAIAPSREEALCLYTSPDVGWEPLAEVARHLREQGKGKTLTYSPKVFLPLTNLCRDRCGYCTFRRDPGQAGAHWMEPEEVLAVAHAGESLGCQEALLSLGDRPEAAFPEAKAWLRQRGFRRTLDYVAATSDLLLEHTALFPHSNPGLMAPSDLFRLKESNVSLGLMLESTSTALFAPGASHEDAVDKWPQRRLRALREAGELKIPFTTGILVGIGESAEDVVDSLCAIRELHLRYGHIQEVIVQNFAPKPGIPMQHWPSPEPQWFARTLALARLILGPEMNVQAPPNLSLQALELLLDSGINDWGGISPLTLDYINPEAPWPAVARLETVARSRGLELRPRLAVYPEYARRPEFFSPRVWKRLQERTDSAGYPLRERKERQNGNAQTDNMTAIHPEVATPWPSSAM
ncbi:MAG: 7,8-didemethyl-8-hydroxy-5-deazariboflavin synthase CofG [Acidobacteria bacterium]|nr:7,8-didemethyl-8-hydroxy-5-deazariboflavin synthase CofG [Acidobacteriota bacterium]